MANDKKEIKTYIWHQPTGRYFFVSTIERDSSAVEIPTQRFMETIAWEYDYETQSRGKIVAQAGDGCALEQHFDVCGQLHRTGEYTEEEA